MKIFISWSGTSSRLVAEALSDWLQRVIQAVKPFYSPDIDKGANWSNEIDNALEGTRFGIICLTPDNLQSSWIHYEAGALSKTKDASIWTFLLDLKPSDVKQPLGRFQHTLSEKSDVLKMLKSINAKLTEVGGESIRENLLEEIFEETWAKFEVRLEKAKESIKYESHNEATAKTESVRNEGDKLDEILEILRSQQRFSINNFEASLSAKKNFEQKSVKTLFDWIQIEISANEDTTELSESQITKALLKCFPVSNLIPIQGKQESVYALTFLNPIDIEHIKNSLEFFSSVTGYGIEIIAIKQHLYS